MWGENWGVMIWGNPIATAIPISSWALIAFGALLGLCALKAKHSKAARVLSILTILLLPVVSVIATNLPYEFVNGTVADADEVNANFQALQDQLSSDIARYEIKAIANGITPATTAAIDHNAYLALCADDNACAIRICSINPNSLSLSLCLRNITMIYRATDGGYRLDDFDFNKSPTGTDGDGTPTSIHDEGFGCEFTDAESSNLLGVAQDNNPGLGLRNKSSTAGHICSIILTD